MDKTVRMETLEDAIAAGIEGRRGEGAAGGNDGGPLPSRPVRGTRIQCRGERYGLWRQGEGVRERRSMRRGFGQRLQLAPDISNWRDACMGLRRCEPSLTRARRECADYIG